MHSYSVAYGFRLSEKFPVVKGFGQFPIWTILEHLQIIYIIILFHALSHTTLHYVNKKSTSNKQHDAAINYNKELITNTC